MEKLFKLTKGIVQGEHTVEMLRKVTEADFFFRTSAQEGQTWCQYYVLGGLLPELLEEAKAAFPARPGCYDQQEIKHIHSNIWTDGNNLKIDFRGCRTDESRKAKARQKFDEFNAANLLLEPTMKFNIVKAANCVFTRMSRDLTDACQRTTIRALTDNPWPGLEDAAGVGGKVQAIKEARETILRLQKEVVTALNTAALREMEQHQWRVSSEGTAVVIDPGTVERLKKEYSNNEAFQCNNLVMI